MSKRIIVALLLFDVAWALAIFGTGRWLGWQVLLTIAILACIPRTHWLNASLLALTGIAIDGLLTASGVMAFATPGLPLFLVVLWLQFALCIAAILDKLPSGWFPLALICALSGGGSYLLGDWLGATQLQPTAWIGALVIALAWAGLFPLVVKRLQHRMA
ncbi:DUF2878 domain-containing protein [Ferrimonas marina]|uniref:DUF2878 domain-containing protein n=1 Tax=Ferrimonas marina TaxID=299255 RepID=A0A1M5Z3M8_9GAMM|nr:DUF2878 domain-containing protein [Ferrimonas marina]SHI18876.1 Protein of unknown function [Ferrimonas marina]